MKMKRYERIMSNMFLGVLILIPATMVFLIMIFLTLVYKFM